MRPATQVRRRRAAKYFSHRCFGDIGVEAATTASTFALVASSMAFDAVGHICVSRRRVAVT
jgi:hypothetical protein